MIKRNPLVSIIIPVYNGEKYLSEAIESVIRQDYKYWELLIVDDCSKDRSYEIAKAYQKKDKRIKVLKNDSKQHGAGAARNYGMDHITGKYLYFIDADDWIDSKLLIETVTLAEETGADLVPFGFCIEDGENVINKPLSPKGTINYKDFKRYAHEILRGTWAECHELIKSEIVCSIRHNNLRTGEDICFQMDVLCNVKKVCGINKNFYHYRIVNNSLSHTHKWDGENEVKKFFEIWNKEKQFLEYCHINIDSQTMKACAIDRYLGHIYYICQPRHNLLFRERYSQIKKLENMKQYKKNYSCKNYSGIGKMQRILVKYNFEIFIIWIGKMILKIRK